MGSLLNALRRLQQFDGHAPSTDHGVTNNQDLLVSGVGIARRQVTEPATPTEPDGNSHDSAPNSVAGAWSEHARGAANATALAVTTAVRQVGRNDTGEFSLSQLETVVKKQLDEIEEVLDEEFSHEPLESIEDNFPACEPASTRFIDQLVQIDADGNLIRPRLSRLSGGIPSHSDHHITEPANEPANTFRLLEENSPLSDPHTTPFGAEPANRPAATDDGTTLSSEWLTFVETPSSATPSRPLELPRRIAEALPVTPPVSPTANAVGFEEATVSAATVRLPSPDVYCSEPTHDLQMALDYAAKVMSETEHLTVDLLDGRRETSTADQLHAAEDLDDHEAWKNELAALGIDVHLLDHELSRTAFSDPVEPRGETVPPAIAQGTAAWRNREEAPLAPPADPAEMVPDAELRVISPGHESALAKLTRTTTAFELDLQTQLQDPVLSAQYRRLAEEVLEAVPNRRAASLALLGCGQERHISEVVAALGTVFADHDAVRVLIVDGNLTHQTLSKHFHYADDPGVAELCVSNRLWEPLVRPTSNPQIWLLPAGGRLDRRKIHQESILALVPRMHAKFNLVIVDVGEADSPLAIPFVNACDLAYVVVRLGATQREMALKTIQHLASNNIRPHGCVVTNAAAA